jgi:hypothetical protein
VVSSVSASEASWWLIVRLIVRLAAPVTRAITPASSASMVLSDSVPAASEISDDWCTPNLDHRGTCLAWAEHREADSATGHVRMCPLLLVARPSHPNRAARARGTAWNGTAADRVWSTVPATTISRSGTCQSHEPVEPVWPMTVGNRRPPVSSRPIWKRMRPSPYSIGQPGARSVLRLRGRPNLLNLRRITSPVVGSSNTSPDTR